MVSHFVGGTQTGCFENRELRKVYGPKTDEDGSWKKLHNDEIHSLNSSPNIVWVIKSRKTMGRDMLHACGRGEVFKGFWLGGPKVRDHWEDLGVNGSITLRWTRWGSMWRTGFGWLMIGSGCGLL
jgi:hypothetical protein